jgi:hypothetical protein
MDGVSVFFSSEKATVLLVFATENHDFWWSNFSIFCCEVQHFCNCATSNFSARFL